MTEPPRTEPPVTERTVRRGAASRPQPAAPDVVPPAGTTGAVLGLLHEARSGERRRRRRSALYGWYCAALLAAIWGLPPLIALAGAATDGQFDGTAAGRLPELLPAVLPALVATVVALLGARGRWHGPVQVEQAALSWLVAHPVSRRALLLPRLLASWVVTGVLGAVAGAAGGFLWHAFGVGVPALMVPAGAFCGAAVGLAGTALAARVQRGAGRSAAGPGGRRAAGGVLAVLWAVALAAGVSQSAAGDGPGLLAEVGLWSGPWGWAVLPLVAAAGGAGPAAALAGGALTVAALAVAAGFGARAAVAVPARVLREQAAVLLRVQASLYALDLRLAWAAVGSVGGGGRGVRMRGGLPAPRRAALVVAWRDATGLVRTPARLLAAMVWTGATLLVAAAVPPSSPVTALAAVTAYVAAAQLAEPARVEAGDLRRSAALPWSTARLAVAHAVVPVAGLVLLLAAGGGATVLLGGPAGAVVPLLLSVPALVGAALVSAYRGVVPPHLMIGSSTPAGDTGPFAALLWQVRGPLVGLLALVAVAAPLRGAGAGVASAVGTLLVGAAMLWWTAATARRTARGR